VKGVPLLYLPIMYYPINDEDRATGFLIPAYGTSKVRGQSLSNAFFWAISRSQDATFFHDWYSKTGQGVGGEYRYIASQGSDGSVRMYWLNEKGTTYESSSGTTELPPRKSYELRGYAQQTLPFKLRARVNIDYFSDITVQQLYHNNLYDASRRQRLYGGNVAGSWGSNRVSFTYNRNEIFYGTTDSQVYGGAPRISYDRASKRIARSPLYFTLGADYNNILRSTSFAGIEYDQGLTRFEVRPAVTAPFTKWPFFTVNGAATFYSTWYSESLDARGVQVNESIARNYLELRADAVGPKLQRVWNTPDNGYAEKFKHVVEPNFSIQRTSFIDNYDSIVKIESNDYVLGGTTRISYGLTNRLLAKRRGGTGQAREFVNVAIFQSYYTDPRASQYDPSYGTSFAGRPPSSFSPIALGARVSPTDRINGALRLEYDYQLKLLQSVRANGSYALDQRLQVSAGWSRRNYVTDLTRSDNYLDVATTAKTADGRIGGSYHFNYDFRRSTLLQQRVQAYYNAQCCGVIAEFQKFGYPRFDPRYPVEADQRFTISFTLAGVGTFSPFLGAFGGSMSSSGRGF
jgi:LPS-assembly protein